MNRATSRIVVCTAVRSSPEGSDDEAEQLHIIVTLDTHRPQEFFLGPTRRSDGHNHMYPSKDGCHFGLEMERLSGTMASLHGSNTQSSSDLNSIMVERVGNVCLCLSVLRRIAPF